MDQLDLDSNGFDPQRYVTHFLKENSIHDLIRRNNSLQQEIKNYDSEIQSLVFQNYSRFISSIETVKKMKSDIFKVDEKMRVLEASMNKITTLATHVDESLSVKRREIVKLHTIKLDLDKFDLLCRFPEILAEDLLAYHNSTSQNNVNYDNIFTNAVHAYASCFTKLEQFQHEQLLKSIYADSIDKVEQIRAILWKCQNSYKPHSQIIARVHAVSHAANSLTTAELRAVTLKLTRITTDQEPVIRNHLRMIKERITAITAHIINSAIVPPHSNSKDSYHADWERLEEFAKQKKHMVSMRELSDFCEIHSHAVITKEGRTEGSMIWLVNSLISNVFSDIKQEMSYLFNELSAATPLCVARESLVESTLKDVLVHVLDEIKKKMARHLTSIEVGECFKNLARCLQEVVFSNMNVKRVLKTSVTDKFSELVEKVCRGQVMHLFGELRNEFVRMVVSAKESCATIESDSDAAILASFADAEANVYRELSRVTSHTKNKLDIAVSYTCLQLRTVLFAPHPEAQFLQADDMFIGLLAQSMADFTQFVPKILTTRHAAVSQETFALLTSMQGFTPSSKDLAAIQAQELLKQFAAVQEPTIYFIFANQLITIYKNKSLAKIFEAFFSTIQPSVLSLARTHPGLSDFYDEEKQQIESQVIGNVVNVCENELSVNYINYIQSVSESILARLNTYFAGFNTSVSRVSSESGNQNVLRVSEAVSGAVGARIPKILLELDLLFPDEKRGLSKKGAFVKNDNGMMIEMERMIVKKSRVYDLKVKQEFARNSLLMSFIRSLAKALIERVRKLAVLNAARLQQIQVDLFFATQLLYEMVTVDDESFVIAAYFEMIESAKHNSLDLTLLDTPQLESLSAAARAAIKI